MFWTVWGAYLCALAGAAAGRVGWRGGEDERRGGDGAGVEDRLGVGGDPGSLADGSSGAGEVHDVDPVELAGDDGPAGAGVVLGDADEVNRLCFGRGGWPGAGWQSRGADLPPRRDS